MAKQKPKKTRPGASRAVHYALEVQAGTMSMENVPQRFQRTVSAVLATGKPEDFFPFSMGLGNQKQSRTNIDIKVT